MFGTALADRIYDMNLKLFKLLFRQIPKGGDVCYFLKILQRSLTFISSVIICRANQAVFYITVGNDDLGIFQFHWCVFIIQSVGIQEDSTVLFTHSTGKLIHDTTVAAIKIILRILTDESKILIGKIKSKGFTQHQPGENFQRCGRREPGTCRNISVD